MTFLCSWCYKNLFNYIHNELCLVAKKEKIKLSSFIEFYNFVLFFKFLANFITNPFGRSHTLIESLMGNHSKRSLWSDHLVKLKNFCSFWMSQGWKMPTKFLTAEIGVKSQFKSSDQEVPTKSTFYAYCDLMVLQ